MTNDDPVIHALQEAIQRREEELSRLREALEERRRLGNKKPRKASRTRKESGPKLGSIPALITQILRKAGKPMTSAELSVALKEQHSKTVESRIVSAAISRYVKAGRIFRLTEDGRYELID